MTPWYIIDAEIKLKFTKENIEKILSKGTEIGFSYFEETYNDSLDAKRAAEKLFESFLRNDKYDYLIYTKYEDAYFNLSMKTKNDSNIQITIHSFCPKWGKQFNRLYTIDYARYIRLLQKLLNDYVILALRADDI